MSPVPLHSKKVFCILNRTTFHIYLLLHLNAKINYLEAFDLIDNACYSLLESIAENQTSNVVIGLEAKYEEELDGHGGLYPKQDQKMWTSLCLHSKMLCMF
jgi:hypothetical protein